MFRGFQHGRVVGEGGGSRGEAVVRGGGEGPKVLVENINWNISAVLRARHGGHSQRDRRSAT